jgi:hypothetical protein
MRFLDLVLALAAKPISTPVVSCKTIRFDPHRDAHSRPAAFQTHFAAALCRLEFVN